MNPIRQVTNFFKAKWRRPKHRGVSGNFSTVVILTTIIIGAYIMSGGSSPEIYPTYYTEPQEVVPITDQPKHSRTNAITFNELKMKPVDHAASPPPAPDQPTASPSAACSQEAIAFLVDVSGSMLDNGKIGKLQAALKQFTAGLPDNALLAIYSFSEPFDGIPGTGPGETGPEPSVAEPRERLAMSKYGDVKSTVPGIISGLQPYRFAATYMRDGFTHAEQWMKAAKSEYPGYKQTLVLISDGVPETDQRSPNDTCFAFGRCYSPLQDPTKDPNLATQIKSDGVTIYSIAIYTQQDTAILSTLQGLLKNIASDPDSTYYHDSEDASTISSILNGIRSDVCSS